MEKLPTRLLLIDRKKTTTKVLGITYLPSLTRDERKIVESFLTKHNLEIGTAIYTLQIYRTKNGESILTHQGVATDSMPNPDRDIKRIDKPIFLYPGKNDFKAGVDDLSKIPKDKKAIKLPKEFPVSKVFISLSTPALFYPVFIDTREVSLNVNDIVNVHDRNDFTLVFPEYKETLGIPEKLLIIFHPEKFGLGSECMFSRRYKPPKPTGRSGITVLLPTRKQPVKGREAEMIYLAVFGEISKHLKLAVNVGRKPDVEHALGTPHGELVVGYIDKRSGRYGLGVFVTEFRPARGIKYDVMTFLFPVPVAFRIPERSIFA